MERCILPVAELFPELVDQLDAVFVYRMCEQTGDAVVDGIFLRNENASSKPYAIGLSVEAMNRGDDYAAHTFLRALAHVEEPGNGGRYYSVVSDMNFRRNQAYMDALAADMSASKPKGRR